MRQLISEKTRQLVAGRANFKCEYCRIHSDDMFLSFELDHIIPLKHGGTNDMENLAFACPHCNQHEALILLQFLEMKLYGFLIQGLIIG